MARINDNKMLQAVLLDENLMKFGNYTPADISTIEQALDSDNYVIGTNIINEAKRLALTIEIYSEEPGLCFQEWYRVVCGEWTIDETGEFSEWWLDEWATYQQMQADLGKGCKIPFDEEEFKQAKLYDGGYWIEKDFEEPDTIPDKPVRLTKDILYKVVDKNE